MTRVAREYATHREFTAVAPRGARGRARPLSTRYGSRTRAAGAVFAGSMQGRDAVRVRLPWMTGGTKPESGISQHTE